MSALTSLLVRDLVVPVRGIEEAIQRQVVSGGDLETVLLEMDAVPENVMAAYRAALHGLLPATRDEVMRAPREVIRVVPREVAEQYGLLPLAAHGRELVVAVTRPLDRDVDEQLAFLLGHELTYRIVAAVRLAAALAHHYGVPVDARLRRLADRLRTRDAGPVPYVAPPEAGRFDTEHPELPGKAGAAGVDDPAGAAPELADRPPQDFGPGHPWSDGEAGRTKRFVALSEQEQQSSSGSVGVTRVVNVGRHGSQPPSTAGDLRAPQSATGTQARADLEATTPGELTSPGAADHGSDAAGPGAIGGATADAARGGAGVLGEETFEPGGPRSSRPPFVFPSVRPAAASQRPSRPSERSGSRAPSDRPRLRGPMTAKQAADLLDRAEQRDDIIDIWVAFARQFFDYVALFVLHSEVAEGRMAHGPGASTEAVRGMAIPLDVPGAFGTARDNAQSMVIDLRVSELDRLVAADLGRLNDQPAALLPTVIRGRAVLLIYGDRGGEDFELNDVPELTAFSMRVSDAFERLIMRQKRSSHVPSAGDGGEGADSSASQVQRSDRASKQPDDRSDGDRSHQTQRSTAVVGDDGSQAPLQSSAASADPVRSPAPQPVASPHVAREPFQILGVPRSAPPPPQITTAATSPSDVDASGAPAGAPFGDAAPTAVVPTATVATEPADAEATAVMPAVPTAPGPPVLGRAEADAMDQQSAPGVLNGPSDRMLSSGNVPRAPAMPREMGSDAMVGDLPAAQAAGALDHAEGVYRFRDAGSEVVSRPPPRREEPVQGDRTERAADAAQVAPSAAGSRDGGERVSARPMGVHRDPSLDPRREGSDAVHQEVVRLPSGRPMPSGAPAQGGGEAPGRREGLEAPPVQDRSLSPAALLAVAQHFVSAPPVVRREPSVIVDMGDRVALAVDDLCRCGPDDEQPVLRELLAIGEAALPELTQRFPGPLWFDRHRPHRRLPRGRDVSPIARAMVAFRERSAPYVASLLDDRDADVRFYATLLASEVPVAGLVKPLGQRIFDRDPGVQALVLDVLKMFRRFDEELEEVRILLRADAKVPRTDSFRADCRRARSASCATWRRCRSWSSC